MLSLRATFTCLLLPLLACITATAHAQQVERNITYTTRGGEQRGDLYTPAGAGPFPVILYIHGGSWRSGSKSNFRQLASDLAAQGYAGFSIDYDLHAGSYPQSWEQARDAVRFLHEHAAQYHLDPANIVVAGASAGGEIAALLALAPEGPASAPDHTAEPVAAAIMLNSVYDLTGSYAVIRRYLGGTCAEVHAACLESSPMQHIHAGAPAFFVGHGTADHIVPFASSQLFTADMQQAGNAVTFFRADGGPHMYFTKARFYAANLAAIEAFLRHTPAR